MEEKKSLKINFSSIISILTLVVMGIGSTFAYFNASVNGALDENISVSSIEVIMNLKIAPLYNGKAILPTNDEDIEKAYKNKCVDSVGNGACIAYVIEIENIGYEQEGVATFLAESETITNLKYMILSDSEEYEVLKPPTSAMDATVEEQLQGIPIKLQSGENSKLIIVIWLSNLNKPQDEEQGGSFIGQASFISTTGAKITGTINESILVQGS